MSDYYAVFDWVHKKAYGPFASRSLAEDWLASQGIYVGQYDDQEVLIVAMRPITEQLEVA